MIEFEGKLPSDRVIAEATSESSNRFTDPASTYFSEERIKAIALDAVGCYPAVQPILQFSIATALEPPVGAVGGVIWAMSLASCITLSGVSLVGADSDIIRAFGSSGLFNPCGLVLGALGALGGDQSMREGADLGSLATDLFSLGKDLKFIESPPPENEAISVFLNSSSDAYSTFQDIESAQKDLSGTDGPDATNAADDETTRIYLDPIVVTPNISSIDPPASQGSDGSGYAGSDDPDDGWC